MMGFFLEKKFPPKRSHWAEVKRQCSWKRIKIPRTWFQIRTHARTVCSTRAWKTIFIERAPNIRYPSSNRKWDTTICTYPSLSSTCLFRVRVHNWLGERLISKISKSECVRIQPHKSCCAHTTATPCRNACVCVHERRVCVCAVCAQERDESMSRVAIAACDA